MTSLQDRDTVIRLIGGYMVSDAIRAAVHLAVFTHLDTTPGMRLEELAARTRAPADHLDRVLNLLRYAGLIEQRESGLHNTRLGTVLVPGKPGSLAAFAENFTSPLFQRAWDHLETSTLTGEAGFDREYHQPVYDYLSQDTGANTLFNQAMQEEATATAESAAALISIGEDETVVDIGGGDGTFLTTVLQTAPTATGIVFDSPAGIAAAENVIARAGLTERCASIAGDFFAAIPPDGTTYIIKSVLQDWDDEHALALLSTCKEQIPDGARLIIIGNFLPDVYTDEAAVGYLTDVCMLVISGGRERTLADLTALLDRAGFNTAELRHQRLGPLTAVELGPRR
ncbi:MULTISPECIES: methyltransferase [Micrococcales]|uniref:Methyltransferase n=1 Tax=Brevibacterium casei TaxID=33889 RepID=A0A269Z6Y5_9MICO|nr:MULTISPECIES: methyltransferase [Micrococcales]KZE91717.1 Multifunctional cyclase-dehydratase-3-O-methyl transferase TcmN [Microbacterium sp. TNHR37B]MCJ2194772.1 acetylserotonin O-methyltransferase [Kaistella montana]NYF28609.1 hypothetical protein [Microbacterium sp. JAI119]PAK93553.1 hypothetical protein B8X04_15415 [Brevibacterium casei]